MRLAALTGAIVVVAGAFGAHALEDMLIEAGHVGTWKTASLYGLVHTVLALLWFAQAPQRRTPGWCWLAGVWLFSGSLHGLALGGPSVLGPITPLGGLLFIVGWFAAMGGLGNAEKRNDEYS